MSNNNTTYKDSPLGKIPSDWEVRHFEDIADIDKDSLKGSTPKDYQFEYVSLSDVDSDIFEIETSTQVFETAPSRARRIVKKGDILMSTVRPNLQGFSLIRNEVKDLIASTGFAVISTTKCSNEFLYQYLFSSGISKQFYQLLVGSNYPAINSSDVKRLKLPYPPLPEQTRIAEVLSAWDKAISNVQATIEQVEQRNKWLMQELLTGKRRLKGFSEEWKEYRLGEVTNNFSRRNKKLVDAKIYSVTNTNGFVLQSEHFEREIAGADLTNYKIIRKNEFAYNPARINVGSIAYFEEEIGVISSLYVCFSTKENVIDFYLMKFLELDHTKYRIDSLGEGGVRVYLWYDLFAKIKIKLPTLEEQTAIAQVLQAAANEVQVLRSKLDKLKEQKKGLMQVLLTGKKRLKIV